MRIYFIFLAAFLFNFSALGMKEEDGDTSSDGKITDIEWKCLIDFLPAMEEKKLEEIISQNMNLPEAQQIVLNGITRVLKLAENQKLKKNDVDNLIETMKTNQDLINNPFIIYSLNEYVSPVYMIWDKLYGMKLKNNLVHVSKKYRNKLKPLLVELVSLANPVVIHHKYSAKELHEHDLLYVFAAFSVGKNLEKTLWDILKRKIVELASSKSKPAIDESKKCIENELNNIIKTKEDGVLKDEFDVQKNKDFRRRLTLLTNMFDELGDSIKGSDRH